MKRLAMGFEFSMDGIPSFIVRKVAAIAKKI
jgi:hypothetical protein